MPARPFRGLRQAGDGVLDEVKVGLIVGRGDMRSQRLNRAAQVGNGPGAGRR